jgi:uncharacterized protein (DUF885 family)
MRCLGLSIVIAAGCVVSPIGVAGATSFEQECANLAARKGNDTDRLHALFKLEWEHRMLQQPEFATAVGYPGQNDRWSDLSVEAIEQLKRELQAPLKVVESIDRSKLSAVDQLSCDLFRKNLEDAAEGTRFKQEFVALTQLSGIHQSAAATLEQAPRATVRDYEDRIARLKALPKAIDQTIILLQKGLEAGITPPRITLRDVPQQVKNQMVEDAEKNALLKSFGEFPLGIPENERARLRQAAAVELKNQVIPALGKLHEFLVTKYLPGARASISAADLPDGKAWYEYLVRISTTTSMTPKQIHELGLSEVKRIRGEMEKVIGQTGFKGNFWDFCKFLRTDPGFYYTEPESLLTGYRDICKRADAELPRLFGKLPRLTYGVKAVPAYAEQSQTTAYYEPGSPEIGRPGWYFANLYALNTRPKWEMEALSLHESVPGHHLQIAIAQEMEGMPEFRKHGGYTAFVEGWGLYSESLGTEMGFYKDPYMKFGQLTYEMWRAVRLVVDTGMHSMGWSRQRAIDFFMANSSKNEHDITVEIDRYIVWPGQALAYKIGELKIKELRAFASRELKERFDVREFHDQVLDSGALPMDILERRIKEWVAEKKRGQNAPE